MSTFSENLKNTQDNNSLRKLSISYVCLGDLESEAGNAVAAREWYEKGLEICKRLVALMPDNVEAQQDLSLSYNCLGDLEKDAENAAAALDWYKKSLAIRKRLLKSSRLKRA